MGHYKQAEDGHKKIKPAYRTAYMGKKPEKAKSWQIPKQHISETGPAPGEYDTATAITKTRWMVQSPPKWSEQRISFVTQAHKNKAWVPGTGTYKPNHSVTSKPTPLTHTVKHDNHLP